MLVTGPAVQFNRLPRRDSGLAQQPARPTLSTAGSSADSPSYASLLKNLRDAVLRLLSSLTRVLGPERAEPTAARRPARSTPFYFRADSKSFQTYGATGATWLTGSRYDPSTIERVVKEAQKQGAIPVIAQYGIPGRDNGGPSGGGALTAEGYRKQLEANAKAIGNAPVLVVIEPDALALGLKAELIKMAVETYRKYSPNAKLYIDAGHAKWQRPETMAKKLIEAGIHLADGFSLNVSAFEWTQDNLTWGDQTIAELAKLDQNLKNKQYVIDTSRNGNGPGVDEHNKNTWGDPVKARNGGPIMNGPKPTSDTGNANCAAFLWVKGPGYGDNRIRRAGEFGGENWVKHHPNPPLAPSGGSSNSR